MSVPPGASAPTAQQHQNGPAAIARPLLYRVWLAVAVGWWLLDQLSKLWAVEALPGRSVDLGLIILDLTRNPGGAFGIPGLPGMFVVVTIVVLFLVLRALPRAEGLWLVVAYGLVTGGALGNVTDRLFRAPGFPSGHVVDFLVFGFWRSFPTFNVADIGITCGATAIAGFMLALDRRERLAERQRLDEGEREAAS